MPFDTTQRPLNIAFAFAANDSEKMECLARRIIDEVSIPDSILVSSAYNVGKEGRPSLFKLVYLMNAKHDFQTSSNIVEKELKEFPDLQFATLGVETGDFVMVAPKTMTPYEIANIYR